ncbi:dienelactone hydrolase family protein [Microbacterium sp. NPDC055599]
MTMHFTSAPRLSDGVIEREFVVRGVPGVLWTPVSASPDTPVPLVLLGQPGGFGLQRMRSRLTGRARACAAQGFAAVAIELPGAGERTPLAGAAEARADLVRALDEARAPGDELIDRLILPLVDAAVPEWQRTMDAVLALPEIGERVGISGGVIAVATRLAAVDPRIVAAGLFAGSYVPRATFAEARRITIPVHVLLQWDDEGNDRAMALELFDAFASSEKTLQANLGGHTGVPAFAADDAARFFARHLGAASG